MGKETAISWCHHTFNIVWGCIHKSPACLHCYAETWSKRLGLNLWGPNTERRTFGDDYWHQPIAWNTQARKAGERRRVFSSSMGDNFEDHPTTKRELEKLWPLINATESLDWLLLTKDIERVLGSLPADWGLGYPNVWIGTTVENQEWANKRIPHLLRIPARIRFLSAGPLLGPIDLTRIDYREYAKSFFRKAAIRMQSTLLDGIVDEMTTPMFLDPLNGRWDDGWDNGDDGARVHWVIAEGESGKNARPTDPDWVRSLRDQCQASGVAFHLKQWGEWQRFGVSSRAEDGETEGDGKFMASGPFIPENHGRWVYKRVGTKANGNVLDGRQWLEVPEVRA